MLAPKNNRGITLLEVMTAAAIMSVTMTVAVSMLVSVVRQQREAERLLDLQQTGLGAQSQMGTDLSNAGFRFPAPAFGAHVFNNVTSLSSGGASPTFIDTSANCGPTGKLPLGTDAIEIVTGNPMFLAGKVQFVDSVVPANPVTDHNIVLVGLTPFTLADVGPSGIALFYDRSGESCIGEVTQGPGTFGSPPQMNVTMLTREFEPVASASTYYPNCPRAGMAIYRYLQRKRFFLCEEPGGQPDGGGTPSTSLWRQQTDPTDGGYIYDNTQMQKLQEGVEDLQITARVNAGPPTSLLGTDVDCQPGIGAGRPSCRCNFTPTSACDLTTPPASLDATQPVAHLLGAEITLTTLGERPTKGDPNEKRPASRDHAAGTVADGKRRLLMNYTLGMNNITQVKP